jgi:hypothetical protein
MTQADRIRQFVVEHYIEPARAAGYSETTARAGDVHQSMGLSNAMPTVCSALGGRKLQNLAGVGLCDRVGPPNGANVYFRYDLRPKAEMRRHGARAGLRTGRTTTQPVAEGVDLRDALVLVSCVKSKLPHEAPARELYVSAWFSKVRDLVEASGARWYILSAYYGLVAPDEVIAPYDHTLNRLGVAERRAWAFKVLARLLPELAGFRRVVVFAGQRYREFLIEPLRLHGVSVEVPMEDLLLGEQLAWLSRHQ